MNQVNFDALKHIKAPQDWIDKAAAIPETSQKRTAVPVYRVVTAASIVLVSVIGLLVFLFFGKDAPVPVRKAQSSSEPAAVSEAADVSSSAPATVNNGTIPSEQQETPTDEHGSAVLPMASTESRNSSVTEAAAHAAPSQHPSEKPPQPTQRNTAPTQDVPPPTQAPELTAPPVPTNPPATQPYSPPGDTEFYGMFKWYDPGTVVGGANYVEAEESLYCRIYDSSGYLIGDGIWLSPQREATILSRFDDGTVYAYYNPTEKGLSITEGVYEYVFYDIHYHELYRDVKYVF